MSMMWVGIGSAVLGAGTSLYGANAQKKASQAASAQNADSMDKQNASAWASYLLSRGVNPNGVATGTMPTNPQAVNTKLPLWATANFAQPNAPRRWVRKGTVPTAGTLSRGAAYTGAPVAAMPVAAPASSGSSRTNDLLIGNPLGIGGKDRNFLDPLGIF